MTIVYNGHFFSTDGVMQLHTTICISNSDLSAYLNRFYILISILTPDNLVRLDPLILIHKTVTSKPKKQTNDRTKREFLLHKEKEENGKPSPQKQEFSCSSPSAVTSQPHTCFFTPTFELKITSIKSHFKPNFFSFTQFSEKY